MKGTAEHTENLHGMQMHFRVGGEGEPLLLLHGFTGSSDDWQYVFSEIPVSYRAIVPDLRGHGGSTNPSKEFTHRQSALDILELLERLGVERIKAIGISGGALTLLHIAVRRPELIEAMVLVSATPYFPEQARRVMSQMTIEDQPPEMWQQMRRRHKHGDDQIRALFAQGNGFKDSYDDVNFTSPLLSTIQARTLIVYGDRDPLYPARMALELYEAIPRSYLWILPNAEHCPIFVERREAFVETALAFLRGEWNSD